MLRLWVRFPRQTGFSEFYLKKKSCPSVVSCNTPVQRTVWGELWVSQLVSHTTSLLNILRVSGNSLDSPNDLGASWFFFFFFFFFCECWGVYILDNSYFLSMCMCMMCLYLGLQLSELVPIDTYIPFSTRSYTNCNLIILDLLYMSCMAIYSHIYVHSLHIYTDNSE